MSKRQATAIIALLAVIAVALVAMFVYLVGFGNDTQQSGQAEGESATETSASAEPAGLDTEESIALLEGRASMSSWHHRFPRLPNGGATMF